jgi:DNA sulfur modification protein DndD
MILNKIAITDFGTFRGHQELALRPKRGKPIILFGGKNGAGKTTLLEAIRLCFYGSACMGSRTSRDEYLAYLESKIHRNPTCIIQPTYAEVALEFEFADVDGIHTYEVSRGWERRVSGRISELLTIKRDGSRLDEVSADHWQDFIRDLVPLGVSQLFFFDGERIQHLAEDASDQATLAAAIKLLLGIDLIERLDTDLGIYVARILKQRRDAIGANQIAQLEEELEKETQRLAELRASLATATSASIAAQQGVDACEQKLTASGGGYARHREELLWPRLRSELNQIRNELQNACAGLLPFAVAPQLCAQLKDRLLEEERTQKSLVLHEFTGFFKTELSSRLRSGAIAADLAPRLIGQLEAELFKLIAEIAGPEPSTQIMHGYSAEIRLQLLSWIEDATVRMPQWLRDKSSRLEVLSREEHAVEADLKKVPTDAVLRPFIEELKSASHKLAETDQRVQAIGEQVRQCELLLRELTRRYQAELDNVSARVLEDQRLTWAPKIQSILKEFRTLAIARKIQELEKSVTECFNLLCRKQDTMRRITIDPTSFAVTIQDKTGRPIPKVQLSAGEKQVYAISMLWALARTSGRPLPVIIDTPLARLDRDHRHLLADRYFPEASHQVIVLSTDTEVDETYFERIAPSVTRAYLLDFDIHESCTRAKSGYFWRGRNEALEGATL